MEDFLKNLSLCRINDIKTIRQTILAYGNLSVQSSIVFVYVRLPAMSAMPRTPVILVRLTFIYMNAGKQVLISMQL